MHSAECLTANPGVAVSSPSPASSLLWRLIMKQFLWPFSPFHWFRQTGQLSVTGKSVCTKYWSTAYSFFNDLLHMLFHRFCQNETRGPWATMLTWVNSYKSLIQHFRLLVVMATNQNEEFVQHLYAWWRTTQQTFIKKLSKYLQWDSNKDLLSLFSL